MTDELKTSQYKVAVADSLPDLQEEVQALIEEGFVPQGGIFVAIRDWRELEALYYQSMFKAGQ